MTYTWRRPVQFTRELKKLGLKVDEATKLTRLMSRFAKGEVLPNDHKVLRDGVEELRMNGDRRIVRLYFSRLDGELVLLALHVHVKKKKNDRDAVDLAVERLKRFGRGEWGV